MRNGYRAAVVFSLATVGLLIVALQSAQARPQYKSAFEKKYTAVAEKNGKKGKLTCTVCHPEKDKKKRNNYGQALQAAFGKKNEKDKAAIGKAMDKAADAPSAIKGKKFGDLLADGMLPASE